MGLTDCESCQQHFDQNSRCPRILPKCGHTLCQTCLQTLINQNTPVICPLDNIIYTNKLIDHFPINQLVLRASKNRRKMCPVHNKPSQYFCLVDKEQICSDCGLFGEHQNHDKKNEEGMVAINSQMLKGVKTVMQGFIYKDNYAENMELQEIVLESVNKKCDKQEREVWQEFNGLVEKIKKRIQNQLQVYKKEMRDFVSSLLQPKNKSFQKFRLQYNLINNKIQQI